MNIQWYPGHMTDARRKMQEEIRSVDLVIELLDARIPLSGKNPDIDKMAEGKKRLLILNKCDLADPELTEKWRNIFEEKGFSVVEMDGRVPKEARLVTKAAETLAKEKRERDMRRGIQPRPIKAMVVGIPNVGKSTFINSYVGRASAKTGNKPGVTKGSQWIRISGSIRLLDTPGILWPKFEDPAAGEKIAYIGSINDAILDTTELGVSLIQYLQKYYCNLLYDRYKIEESDDPYEALMKIAELKKCLKTGGEYDPDRAAKLFLDDVRSARVGRITFDRP